MQTAKLRPLSIKTNRKNKREFDVITLSREISTYSKKEDNMAKFEMYGHEMIEKEVRVSGNSGRIYLPPSWVGHRVKIVRIE